MREIALGTFWLAFQTVGDAGSSLSTNIIERAIREGGFFLLVLVILYFYRRDTKWAAEFWKAEALERGNILRENAKTQADVASALRENNVIVHQAKNVMAQYLPLLRREDNDRAMGRERVRDATS